VEFGPRYAESGSKEARRAREEAPPGSSIAWVVDGLGASDLVSVTALRGGISSAVHRFTLRFGRDVQRVVLRRYVFPVEVAAEPSVAQHEADALQLVAGLPLGTPRLLACDPTAAVTDVPAVLMTFLPGRTEWTPTKPGPWLEAVAAAAAAVHALEVDPAIERDLRSFAPNEPTSTEPPAWAKQPAVWARALELFDAGPGSDEPRVLIHRDLHPGNVLWHDGTISGLVDWQGACLGPPSIDIGHCRLNLLAYQPGWADALTAAWERRSGRRYHPWADVAAIIGLLGDLRDAPPPRGVRPTIEGALASAVAALSG